MSQKNDNAEGQKREHLNREERNIIERMLRHGVDKGEIARALRRAKSTIKREIRRGAVVQEEEPPPGSEGIEWFLVTNEETGDAEAAYEKVGYYIQRWKIERFHHVLKSGCKREKLQECSRERMKVLILMYSGIAVYILNLTYIARINPDLPCTILFEELEWKLLYCAANRTKEVPDEPYTIKQAVDYVGALGGPKRAPSDGPPGLKPFGQGCRSRTHSWITANCLILWVKFRPKCGITAGVAASRREDYREKGSI